MAFVFAFFVTTLLHEGGHFISWQLAGYPAILHHNYVETFGENVSQSVIIISALAGPVVSLIQGIIVNLFISRRTGNSAPDLLLIWISLLGFVNFFGYLMMTPFFIAGDTGKVAEILNFAMIYRYLIAGIGLAVLILIILRTGRHFARFIPADAAGTARNKYLNHLLLFPIVTGSVINVMLAFPVVTILSIIYPATSSFVIMSCYGSALKHENSTYKAVPVTEGIAGLLVWLTICGIITNRLLTLGIG